MLPIIKKNMFIYGAPIKLKTDFFELPIKSSNKLISLQYKDAFVFIPLIHTLDK